MANKIKIAIDAMGGENSPAKIIHGIEISINKNKDNFFYLFGKKSTLEKEISKRSSIKPYCEIINSDDFIQDDESPLAGAKKSKNTSMWMTYRFTKRKKN